MTSRRLIMHHRSFYRRIKRDQCRNQLIHRLKKWIVFVLLELHLNYFCLTSHYLRERESSFRSSLQFTKCTYSSYLHVDVFEMSFKPRCNLCFSAVDSSQCLFTSCGHFVCEKCKESKMSREMDICPFCRDSCSTLFLDVMESCRTMWLPRILFRRKSSNTLAGTQEKWFPRPSTFST